MERAAHAAVMTQCTRMGAGALSLSSVSRDGETQHPADRTDRQISGHSRSAAPPATAIGNGTLTFAGFAIRRARGATVAAPRDGRR